MLALFINVVLPVFAVIFIGYISKRVLKIDSSSLSKISYNVFIPAFVFNMMLKTDIPVAIVVKMILYISLVYIICGLIGFGVAKMLGHITKMAIAFLMVTSFGNIGNMGLTVINFKLGEEALPVGTLYYITLMIVSLVICIVSVNIHHQGDLKKSLLNILKTPALIAVASAFVFILTGIKVPVFLDKITALLGSAMIPVLIITLGIQLGEVEQVKITRDVVIASAIRLIGGPAIALLLIIPFSLPEVGYNTGIIQASMPTALIVSIFAIEHKIAPDFVITTILFSTIISPITLMVVLYYF